MKTMSGYLKRGDMVQVIIQKQHTKYLSFSPIEAGKPVTKSVTGGKMDGQGDYNTAPNILKNTSRNIYVRPHGMNLWYYGPKSVFNTNKKMYPYLHLCINH